MELDLIIIKIQIMMSWIVMVIQQIKDGRYSIIAQQNYCVNLLLETERRKQNNTVMAGLEPRHVKPSLT